MLENKLVLVELPDVTDVFEENGNYVDNDENLVAHNKGLGLSHLLSLLC